MRHVMKRWAVALAAALLIALLTSAAFALETISNVKISADGVMTWSAWPGATDYMLSIDGGGIFASSGVNLKNIIEESLAADHLHNTPSHDVELVAFDEIGAVASWTGSFDYLSPNYPEYSVPKTPLKDSAKLSGGVLSWTAYSTDTTYYSYEVKVGDKALSAMTGTLSVDIHAYINEAVTNGDLPNATKFTITLSALDHSSKALDTYVIKDYAYTPVISKIDLGDGTLSASGIKDSYDYTGKAVEPKLTGVFIRGKTLSEGADYTVSYENNVEPGVGYVVLKGVGKYTGTSKCPFNISAAPKPALTAGIDAAGTLRWEALAGAAAYWYDVEGLSRSTDQLSADLGAYVAELVAAGTLAPAQRYAASLFAADGNGNPISETWTGEYIPGTATDIDIALCAVSVENPTYTGKGLKPKPTVTFLGETLVKGTDYKVSYKNNKKVGAATLTVTGLGRCKGKQKVSFKVLPKGTSLSKLTAGKKKITAAWKKQSKYVTGYQLQYATKKSFSGGKKVTVKGAGTLKKALEKLKGGKKYYVRIRTYYKKGGKTYYSAWSKAKSVKTKK